MIIIVLISSFFPHSCAIKMSETHFFKVAFGIVIGKTNFFKFCIVLISNCLIPLTAQNSSYSKIFGMQFEFNIPV